jgi:fumarate reductase subunit D
LRDLAAHGLVKIAIVGVVFLSLWSAAHRLRITCYDFGVRADTLVATVVYAVAILATIATAVCLASV